MTQIFSTLTVVTVVMLSALSSHALKCVKRDGEFALRDNGEDIPPGPFHCLRVTAQHKTKKSTIVTFLKDTKNGPRCRVEVSEKKKSGSGTRYAKSEVPTGTYCKYKCVEGNGYDCVRTVKREGACACQRAKPRVVTVPVVGGEGLDALGETCDDKWLGYEFADAVACTRIEGDFKKERLVEIDEKKGICERKVERLFETRYMRTQKVDRNVQGCVYVCKEGLVTCIRKEKGKRCKCGRVGLRKVLIGMNENEVEGRVDQTKCVGDDCGPCGVCKRGECVLKKGASKGNFCPCGEICPAVDRRKGGKGGKIFCEPNWRLTCRTVPKWMQVEEPGTVEPDLCTSGRRDAADRCGCKEGYKKVHARYGKTFCRPGRK